MPKKPKEKLLFVDTNKLLDFYRSRNEAGLSLLRHLDQLHDRTISSFQVEMEFKRHRVSAIIEAVRSLKVETGNLALPAFLYEAKTVQMIKKNLKDCTARVNRLKKRVKAVLDYPPLHDEVYKIAQRLFSGTSAFNLRIDHPQAGAIKRKGWHRFIQGCPPRKQSDTSYGDAINWEWILECIRSSNKDVVIVSRDTDYGTKMDDAIYANDWLMAEVKRINKQRRILVFDKLSDALEELHVTVSAEEQREENKTLADIPPLDFADPTAPFLAPLPTNIFAAEQPYPRLEFDPATGRFKVIPPTSVQMPKISLTDAAKRISNEPIN
jgi:predicted nucleic acid-binding protein